MERASIFALLGALCALGPACGQGRPEEAPGTPVPPADVVCETGVPDGKGGCDETPAGRRAAMTDQQVRDHLWSECPDPVLGSFADRWAWTPDAAEQRVLAFACQDEGTVFVPLSDFEGLTVILQVNDGASGEKLAVLKTGTSGTRVEAEVYAYRLARFLGFDSIVVLSAPCELRGPQLEKMRDLLATMSYRYAPKERRRVDLVRQIEALLAEGGALTCAIKPWERAFMFNQTLGERESLGRHAVMDHLHGQSPQPPDDRMVELQQWTGLYRPRGTHRGRIWMHQLAADLSSIMLLDALIGNDDRFPGGNLHMRSIAGSRVDTGVERRGAPVWELGEVRLFALDNGSGLKSKSPAGLRDLQGKIHRPTRIERFERRSVEGVRALSRRALGHRCEHPAFEDEAAAIWRSHFGLDERQGALAASLLREVVHYLDGLEAEHGDAIYFAGSAAAPR